MVVQDLTESGYPCLSFCYVFVFIFNPVCTYHAASPPGSEQERLEYALNSKRKALILALRWANSHTYLLQEEPAAITFLEVTKSKLLNAGNNISYCITRMFSIPFFFSVPVGVVWECFKRFSDIERFERLHS